MTFLSQDAKIESCAARKPDVDVFMSSLCDVSKFCELCDDDPCHSLKLYDL